jgi:hypothetical protein
LSEIPKSPSSSRRNRNVCPANSGGLSYSHQVTIDAPNLTIEKMHSAKIAAIVKEFEIEAEYMDRWWLTHDLSLFLQSFARKLMLAFRKRGFA